MCGFTGFLTAAASTDAESLACVAGEMAATLAHRGPDDADVWVDPSAGIAFGHRRLSIIDLSQHGRQPMHSHSGRYVVAYNGELYNYLDVRAQLEGLGHRFTGHSDTEVLLTAIEQWGIHNALERFTGMFAFALWDRNGRSLHLARDRMGEKPLYYGWRNGVFLFGSELKALRRHPVWHGEIDQEALTLYLRFGYVPAPWSIYAGVRKLRSGCTISVTAGDAGVLPEPRSYWCARDAAAAGALQPFAGSESEAAEQLEELLLSAVRRQMIADVPLGAFLSGGVDSSTIVALMQAQSDRPVRTFTIGFHEAGYNEAEHAKAVAKHLGTDHTELYVTARTTMDVVPLLPGMYDEPFADSSQIPTYLVSWLARQHVTVSLSGDGGDELFGGYNRYFVGPRIWRRIERFPPSVRAAAGTMMESIGVRRWNAVGDAAGRLFGSSRVPHQLGEKMAKLAGVMRADGPELLYKTLVSATTSPTAFVRGSREPDTMIDSPADLPEFAGFTQRMMYLDALTYLPDDILVKVDRASMACSLESRAPFLDHRVVELAWRLPLDYKVRGSTGKWILRQILYKYVPRGLIERPKAGFGIPIGQWLRGPFRDWAEGLLAEPRIRQDGFFDVHAVRRAWQEHLSGHYDRQSVLWALLMFQAWLEAEREMPAAVATS